MDLNLRLKSHFVHSSTHFTDILHKWNALNTKTVFSQDNKQHVNFRRSVRTPIKKRNMNWKDHFLMTCNSNSECSICINNTVNPSNGGKLISCNHTFHTECILKWLSRKDSQNKCPNCRNTVLNIDIYLTY
jgi:hypothetical protein